MRFSSVFASCSFFILSAIVLGKPIEPPDLSKCEPISDSIDCCLPKSNKIVDFSPPPQPQRLRVRPAAHLVDEQYVAKYANATRLMKNLPKNHPWNFMQQANIHCAYCDGLYNQTSYPNVTLQVHSSWLFFPFHRAYLYFYEKILGKLIGDESFAIPFWNWDAPAGMTFPAIYTNKNSSLHDQNRYANHMPPAIVGYGREGANESEPTSSNLAAMYRQMVSGANTTELFLGGPYRAGDESSSPGTIEMFPHGYVHVWTGEDMSSFETAGRDPAFYAHHSNVDRMWAVWKTMPGSNHTDYTDPDWLDAAFVFWDEHLQLVRIRVRDLVDTTKLGYVYQNVPIHWLNVTNKVSMRNITGAKLRTLGFPLRLDSAVSLRVELPEKQKQKHEVLVLDGIEFDVREYVKFDVYVGAPNSNGSSAFAGRFAHLATRRKNRTMKKARLVLGVTDLLQHMNLWRFGSVFVTLIPRADNGNVTVGGIRIGFSG